MRNVYTLWTRNYPPRKQTFKIKIMSIQRYTHKDILCIGKKSTISSFLGKWLNKLWHIDLLTLGRH